MPYNFRGFYRAEWEINGQRFQRMTDIPCDSTKKNKDAAKRLQDQWRKDAEIEIAVAEKTRARNPKGKILDQTLDEAVAEYFEDHEGEWRGLQDIKADFERIVGYLGATFMIGDIDTEVIIGMMNRRKKEFVKLRTKDGKPKIDKKSGLPKPRKLISPRTVNITVGERMKWFLAHMAAKGRQIQPIQWEKVWVRETPRVTEFTYEHEIMMLETYRKDHLPALAFALLGGPRREQFVSLRWSQIDWRKRTITFENLKKKPKKGLPPAPYVLPMTPAIENLILSQIDEETNRPYHPEFVWTFIGERTVWNPTAGRFYEEGEHYPLTYEGLGSEWRRWKESDRVQAIMQERGLSDFRMHDLRHAAGERLAEACSDPLIVRDGMHHGDLATTERYMGRVKVARIAAAMEARTAMDRQYLMAQVPTSSPSHDPSHIGKRSEN